MKVSDTDPPVLNASVPTWPCNSGRAGKVMEISGTPAGQMGTAALNANCPPVGTVVVPPTVVVVAPGAVVVVAPGAVVVVAPTVVVVAPTVVVVAAAVVVVAAAVVVVAAAVVVVAAAVVVVVVPPLGAGHAPTSGSGWPVSKAMTIDRPWASENLEPMSMGPLVRELIETLIGLPPPCSSSKPVSPGLRTYLQTKTLSLGNSWLDADGVPQAANAPTPSKASARTALIYLSLRSCSRLPSRGTSIAAWCRRQRRLAD